MQTNRKGYHDIEVDFEGIMLEGGMVDELFRLQDLRNRKLFLNEGIDQCSVADIVKHILQYNSDDKGIAPEDRKPILLYVVSEGGDVDSGFELIDTIQCSKTPIYTINLGYQYSMGFLIGLAGHNQGKVEIVHLGFIRGRDIKNSIIMCSEIENMTKEHIQLLIGRVGEGSALWLDGDVKQVDAEVFQENSGMQIALDKLKGHPRFGYVKLLKTERSETAAMADLLD